jgi:hypothetical protein
MVPCAAILLCAAQASFAADLITGSARNASRAQPAAGDEVVLLRLGRSTREEARTRTDALGGFTFDLEDPGHPHIVRVIHQGVNYDRQVTAGGVISIDVFDATAKAQGVTGSIEILRAGTRGTTLHVSDMIEIRNGSNPPVTQAGPRSFEVYLPANATINLVLAAGPDNVASKIAAAPVTGEPGHYTVNFPLRPGATKFSFNYDLPYSGHARLRANRVYPFQQLAVMIPRTMTFTAGSSAFQALAVGNKPYHVEAAENVKAGAGLEFEISGAGALPGIEAQGQTSPNAPAAAATAPAPATAAEAFPTPKAAPIAGPARERAARASNAWWWVWGAAAALGLAVCVFLVRHQRLQHSRLALVAQPQPPLLDSAASLVDALKEGLAQLESDRVRGLIGGEEYTSVKRGLEGTIHWALTRAENREANTAAS